MKKIIVLALCFIIGCKNAQAAENDSKIEINYIENIYSNREINGQFYDGLQGIVYIDGNVGYCIDPTLIITNDIYSSSGDFSVMSITEEQLSYLEIISYFGYGYTGRTDNKYYLATQEIIWEFLTNGEMYWTNGRAGDVINIDSYKNEIITSVNQYLAVPDFPSYIETDQYKDIILEDKSGSLKYYRSNLWLGKIEDNKLILNANKKGTVTIKLTKQPLNYKVSYIYMSENSQTLATFGFSSNKTSSISVKYKVKTKTQLTLIKKDSSDRKTIKNKETKIKIYDVNKNEYIKENDSEIITIKESGIYVTETYLEEGTYKIEEVEAPAGYKLLAEPITFIVHEYDGPMMTIGIYNNPILYGLKIQKTGEVYSGINEIDEQMIGTYELEKMNNIVYGLYAKDDILDAEGSILYEKDSLINKVTIKNGIGSLSGLQYGKYYIKELECPEAYILDITETEVDFTTNETSKTFKFVNYLKKGDILIKKIDNKNNGLEGASFILKGASNPLNISLKSNSIGSVIIKDIPYDTYYLTETKSPDGYKLDSEERKLELNSLKLYYEFVNEREVVPEETPDKEEPKEEVVPEVTPDKEEPKEEVVPEVTPDKEEPNEEVVPEVTPDKEEPKEEVVPEVTPDKEEPKEEVVPEVTPDKEEPKEEVVPEVTPDKEEPREEMPQKSPVEKDSEKEILEQELPLKDYIDTIVENPNTLTKLSSELFVLNILLCIGIILYVRIK